MPDSIVEVYTALNAQQAHLVLLALEDAGIEGQVVGDKLQQAAGDLPLGWATAPRIWVSREDAPAAREAIAAWETACASDRPEPNRQPWVCSACGAKVDANFDICWNCQHDREMSA